MVEHRGFEPLTPTLPVLCAPNCANAPNGYSIPYFFADCKRENEKKQNFFGGGERETHGARGG